MDGCCVDVGVDGMAGGINFKCFKFGSTDFRVRGGGHQVLIKSPCPISNPSWPANVRSGFGVTPPDRSQEGNLIWYGGQRIGG